MTAAKRIAGVLRQPSGVRGSQEPAAAVGGQARRSVMVVHGLLPVRFHGVDIALTVCEDVCATG